MGPVTYEIHHPDNHQRGSPSQPLEPPERKPQSALMIRQVKDVEEEDGSEVAERHASVVSLTHLEDIKRQELQHLLDQFPALFHQRPGRTALIHHTIHLTDTTPSLRVCIDFRKLNAQSQFDA